MNAQILNLLWQTSVFYSGLPDGLSAAEGSILSDSRTAYTDFHSGSSRFNYGYSNQQLLSLLAADIDANGPIGTGTRTHKIKTSFFSTFQDLVLKPRNLNYKIQLASSNSSCAIESAINIAKYITGRKTIISFADGLYPKLENPAQFNSVNNVFKYFKNQNQVKFMPYDKCLGPDLDTIVYLSDYLKGINNSDDIPAAVVVETVAAHDGSNSISWRWIKDLQKLCLDYGIKLIVDDTQVGCGRTGKFFSFESADIKPDVVVLTKSISGFGLPVSVLLINQEFDITGMKVGSYWSKLLDHDLALLSATHVLQTFWHNDDFAQEVQAKEIVVRDWLENIVNSYKEHDFQVMGRGLVQGLVINSENNLASNIANKALSMGVLVHTSGLNDHIIKITPALTIKHNTLISGLERLEQSIFQVLNQVHRKQGR